MSVIRRPPGPDARAGESAPEAALAVRAITPPSLENHVTKLGRQWSGANPEAVERLAGSELERESPWQCRREELLPPLSPEDRPSDPLRPEGRHQADARFRARAVS